MDDRRTHAISADEAERHFERYQDEATKGPVLITRPGGPTTVLLSYAEFVRLNGNDRRAYSIDDLPEHLVQAILDAEVPDELGDEAKPARTPS